MQYRGERTLAVKGEEERVPCCARLQPHTRPIFQISTRRGPVTGRGGRFFEGPPKKASAWLPGALQLHCLPRHPPLCHARPRCTLVADVLLPRGPGALRFGLTISHDSFYLHSSPLFHANLVFLITLLLYHVLLFSQVSQSCGPSQSSTHL